MTEVHDQIVKDISLVISGRESARKKILLFRRRWPHYFQSIQLYNRVIELLRQPGRDPQMNTVTTNKGVDRTPVFYKVKVVIKLGSFAKNVFSVWKYVSLEKTLLLPIEISFTSCLTGASLTSRQIQSFSFSMKLKNFLPQSTSVCSNNNCVLLHLFYCTKTLH